MLLLLSRFYFNADCRGIPARFWPRWTCDARLIPQAPSDLNAGARRSALPETKRTSAKRSQVLRPRVFFGSIRSSASEELVLAAFGFTRARVTAIGSDRTRVARCSRVAAAVVVIDAKVFDDAPGGRAERPQRQVAACVAAFGRFPVEDTKGMKTV